VILIKNMDHVFCQIFQFFLEQKTQSSLKAKLALTHDILYVIWCTIKSARSKLHVKNKHHYRKHYSITTFHLKKIKYFNCGIKYFNWFACGSK